MVKKIENAQFLRSNKRLINMITLRKSCFPIFENDTNFGYAYPPGHRVGGRKKPVPINGKYLCDIHFKYRENDEFDGKIKKKQWIRKPCQLNTFLVLENHVLYIVTDPIDKKKIIKHSIYTNSRPASAYGACAGSVFCGLGLGILLGYAKFKGN